MKKKKAEARGGARPGAGAPKGERKPAEEKAKKRTISLSPALWAAVDRAAKESGEGTSGTIARAIKLAYQQPA